MEVCKTMTFTELIEDMGANPTKYNYLGKWDYVYCKTKPTIYYQDSQNIEVHEGDYLTGHPLLYVMVFKTKPTKLEIEEIVAYPTEKRVSILKLQEGYIIGG
jgi:hypothetical protein